MSLSELAYFSWKDEQQSRQSGFCFLHVPIFSLNIPSFDCLGKDEQPNENLSGHAFIRSGCGKAPFQFGRGLFLQPVGACYTKGDFKNERRNEEKEVSFQVYFGHGCQVDPSSIAV